MGLTVTPEDFVVGEGAVLRATWGGSGQGVRVFGVTVLGAMASIGARSA